MGLLQGLANNLQEVSVEEIQKDFGAYLMQDEAILRAFKLVRDVLILTNCRIIDFDKQGATGKKMSVNSIYLSSVYKVSCETAGFGFDDSEITIFFIDSPYYKANEISVSSKKYEFPKNFDVASLYKTLEEYAHYNRQVLNT